MTRHTRHRRDANHSAIEGALRRVTAVRDVHNYGGGMGDLIARHVVTKQAVFLEIKAKASDKLTETERAFADDFRASWCVVHSIDEALAAVGAFQKWHADDADIAFNEVKAFVTEQKAKG